MDHTDRDTDDPAEPIQQLRVTGDLQRRRSCALVADHPQAIESSLGLAGYLVLIAGPGPTHQAEMLVSFENQREELRTTEAMSHVADCVELVRDHHLGMGVECGTYQCVSAAGVADEEAEVLQVGEVGVAHCAPRGRCVQLRPLDLATRAT